MNNLNLHGSASGKIPQTPKSDCPSSLERPAALITKPAPISKEISQPKKATSISKPRNFHRDTNDGSFLSLGTSARKPRGIPMPEAHISNHFPGFPTPSAAPAHLTGLGGAGGGHLLANNNNNSSSLSPSPSSMNPYWPYYYSMMPQPYLPSMETNSGIMDPNPGYPTSAYLGASGSHSGYSWPGALPASNPYMAGGYNNHHSSMGWAQPSDPTGTSTSMHPYAFLPSGAYALPANMMHSRINHGGRPDMADEDAINMGETPGTPIVRDRSLPIKGPQDGCNLFVFHIPNRMTNKVLYQLFAPFGDVISVRIITERGTGRSRGFGFVSFKEPESATNAIMALNGFEIGGKRLKVQLKTDRDNHEDDFSAAQQHSHRGSAAIGSMTSSATITRIPSGEFDSIAEDDAVPLATAMEDSGIIEDDHSVDTVDNEANALTTRVHELALQDKTETSRSKSPPKPTGDDGSRE